MREIAADPTRRHMNSCRVPKNKVWEIERIYTRVWFLQQLLYMVHEYCQCRKTKFWRLNICIRECGDHRELTWYKNMVSSWGFNKKNTSGSEREQIILMMMMVMMMVKEEVMYVCIMYVCMYVCMMHVCMYADSGRKHVQKTDHHHTILYHTSSSCSRV